MQRLAEVQRRLLERAAWLRDAPLAVEPDLWREARAEHEQVLEKRGWSIANDNNLSRRGIAHFLLMGVPIVMDEA